LPILLLVLMGIIDGGRLIYAYNTVSNAAREGGRTAIINQDAQTVRERAASQATGLGIGATDLGNDCPTGGGPPVIAPTGVCFKLLDPVAGSACAPVAIGCVSVVSVKWTYRPIAPIIGNLIGSVPLVSTTRQAVESICPPQRSPSVPCPVRGTP